MSSSKRKTTTSISTTTTARSSGGDSRRSNSGTRRSKIRAATIRMRTRSQAKAQCPQIPKRPKPRHETRQDNVFAIKDIIDEKFVRGRLHYRIDWEDDPNTGEPFSPTWVCQPSPHQFNPGTNHEYRSLLRTQARTQSGTGSSTSSVAPGSALVQRTSPTLEHLRPRHLVRPQLEESSSSCSPSRIS